MKDKYRFNIKQMSADCEANYARLCRLFPAVPALADEARQAAGDGSGRSAFTATERELLIELNIDAPARLHIAVAEQCRYTTTLALEFRLQAADISGSLPDQAGGTINMSVRMYHDVNLAEVIAFSGQRTALASYQYPNDMMFHPDEKAQQNHFLAELLSLGLQRGLATLEANVEACSMGPLDSVLQVGTARQL